MQKNNAAASPCSERYIVGYKAWTQTLTIHNTKKTFFGQGGLQFQINLTEELSEDDKSGFAHFEGIGDVCLERLNCNYTLAGILPGKFKVQLTPHFFSFIEIY